MAVTFFDYAINQNSSAPYNVDTLSAVNFLSFGSNRLSIAYILTFADTASASHDSVTVSLTEDHVFTKIKTQNFGTFAKITWWAYVGIPDGNGTISCKIGREASGKNQFYFGGLNIYGAYQGLDFLFASSFDESSSITQSEIQALNGSKMFALGMSSGTPDQGISYSSPQLSTGIGSAGHFFEYEGISTYRSYMALTQEEVSSSAVDTIFTTLGDATWLYHSGILVMPAGWTKPDWFDLIGDYVEPPCGYVGQVVSSSPSLTHLEGQTVSILANGEVLDQQEVVDGAVTFPSGISTLHIGLPFIADLETLNIKVPLRDLSEAQNIRAKVANVTFHLLNSRGGWIGPDTDSLWEAFTQDAFRQYSGQNLDETEMFSGKIRQPLGAGYDQGGRVCVRQYDPLPITVGAIMPEVDLGGVAR